MNTVSVQDIDWVVYDFDGVMTNNRALVLQDGTEAVWVHRGDGLGVDMIRRTHLRQMILSTETNPVVTARARKLKIDVVQGSRNKREALLTLCQRDSIDPARILYVGNDLNDLEVMQTVGYPCAPADAHPEILNLAKFVTQAHGGNGVIREIAERILGLKAY